MSDRGSFVTEYIFCKKCLETAKRHLVRNDKYLCSQVINGWNDESLPIIAGKIGGTYSGEEIVEFDTNIRSGLESDICHNIRIAVLAEVGQEILNMTPRNGDK